jgi:hypothetical protein
MTLVLTVETSFGGNEMQLAHVADYLNGHFAPASRANRWPFRCSRRV